MLNCTKVKKFVGLSWGMTEDIMRDVVVHDESIADRHSSIVPVVVVVPQAADDREVLELSATEKYPPAKEGVAESSTKRQLGNLS